MSARRAPHLPTVVGPSKEQVLTLQPKAESVDGSKFLSQAKQVDGEVGLQQVQEARNKRWEVEAPELPLAPQQAGTSQQGQQQQPKEQHGRKHKQRLWPGHL